MTFKNLETYISDLLYRHNLVILPGFGAFIGRRKPARVHSENGFFHPPSKEISFNALVNKDDGLLADYVARKENTSYSEAESYISDRIAEWKYELNRNKRLRLEGIGFFSLVEDKIVFTPFPDKNYLSEAFGLHPFIRKPLQKTVDLRLAPDMSETTIPISTSRKVRFAYPEFPQRTGNTTGKPWLKYAAAAVVAISLLWGGYQFKDRIISSGNTQIHQATYQIPDRFPEIIIPVRTQKEHSALTENTTSYHVIIGAFKHKKNALKLVNKLKERGIDAGIPGQNPDGLYYVAHTTVTNPGQAEQLVRQLQSEFPGAWILAR